MSLFRSPEMELKYKTFKENNPVVYNNWNESENLIKEYNHWKIVKNTFYYDKLLTLHHLLIPKRQFKRFFQMKGIERKELEMIDKELESKGTYESKMTNFIKTRSVTNIFHIHCVVWKNNKI